MRVARLLLISLSLLLLRGCQNVGNTPQIETTLSSESELIGANLVAVNGRSFSIEEINAGIKDTFNCVLYHHGYRTGDNYLISNPDLILRKDVEYDLYFESNYQNGIYTFSPTPNLHLLITNMEDPLSTEENPLRYMFSIGITEWGMRSCFSSLGCLSTEQAQELKNDRYIFLGHYTMHIDEIEKPPFEDMDAEWSENVESAIRLYMGEGKYFEPGSYHVYMQRFFESDADSIIIFEHENGDIYIGSYYFVHEISGEREADLNKVILNKGPHSESFKAYVEIVKQDPAVSMEYVIS